MEVDSNVSFSTEGQQRILCAFHTPNEVPRFSLSDIIHLQFKSGCRSEMNNIKFSYKMNSALCGCSTAGKGHVHHIMTILLCMHMQNFCSSGQLSNFITRTDT